MWKYSAFVLLVIFCASAVLAEESSNSSTVDTSVSGSLGTSTEISPVETIAGGAETSEVSPEISSVSPTTETSETNSTATPEAPVINGTTESTSEAPVTTSSPTTSIAPPTTALPPPAVGKYAIHEKDEVNKTCLMVEMALRVDISDPKLQYNFPPNASTEGSECNSTNEEQILELADAGTGASLSMIFVKTDKKYYVQNISLTYPKLAVEEKTSGQYFSASKGNSYLCKSEMPVHMKNVTLTFSSVHIQAYGDKFGSAEECDADDKVGDVVPIAVGCALGLLVVIVLIAYLVGRRRSRQRGYQSV